MRRSSIQSVLVLVLSLAGCASPEAPTSVVTGLTADRPLAELDDAEAHQACEGWVAYASTVYGEDDGPLELGCRLEAAFGTEDAASCEVAYAACIAAQPSLDTFCDDSAHAVPDCDRSITVDHYESCMTVHIELGATTEIDCSLAGQDDQIRARLAPWTVTPDCAALTQRECAITLPIEP